MDRRISTAERILIASRQRFNKKGFAATTLTEIADDVGISQGNLSYHFPTKNDLVIRLQKELRRHAQARLGHAKSGSVSQDYVEHLLSGMTMMWENRFIFRDRSQYADDNISAQTDPEMVTDFEALFSLVRRIEKEGMFRSDLQVDLETLTRSLWIISRYWMDHLHEFEGREEIAWEDQERGIQHHFAVLLPCLLSSARKEFLDTLARFSKNQAQPHVAQ